MTGMGHFLYNSLSKSLKYDVWLWGAISFGASYQNHRIINCIGWDFIDFNKESLQKHPWDWWDQTCSRWSSFERLSNGSGSRSKYVFVPRSKLFDFMHLKSQGCRSCFLVYFVWVISGHLLNISLVAWSTHLHHWNMNCNGYKQIPQFLLYQIDLTLQRKHCVLYEITINAWG